MACYAGFLAGREAARLMLPRGCGCIFFTGATGVCGRRRLRRVSRAEIRSAPVARALRESSAPGIFTSPI